MSASENAWAALSGAARKARVRRMPAPRLALVFAAALSLFGCGLQTETIAISYVPQEAAPVLPGAGGQVIDVQVADLRSNKSEVSKKGDEYEILAPILIENDVAQLLREAIETELENRGFSVGEGGIVVLAELSKFYNRFRASTSEAEVFIHVQVKKPQGDLIYSEIVAGKGIEPDVVLRSGENAKLALEAAMRDAVAKLMSNVEFLDAMIEAHQT